jgi:hypothetical protein
VPFTAKATYEKESAIALAGIYRHTFSAILAKIPVNPFAQMLLQVAVTLCSSLIVAALKILLFLRLLPQA